MLQIHQNFIDSMEVLGQQATHAIIDMDPIPLQSAIVVCGHDQNLQRCDNKDMLVQSMRRSIARELFHRADTRNMENPDTYAIMYTSPQWLLNIEKRNDDTKIRYMGVGFRFGEPGLGFAFLINLINGVHYLQTSANIHINNRICGQSSHELKNNDVIRIIKKNTSPEATMYASKLLHQKMMTREGILFAEVKPEFHSPRDLCVEYIYTKGRSFLKSRPAGNVQLAADIHVRADLSVDVQPPAVPMSQFGRPMRSNYEAFMQVMRLAPEPAQALPAAAAPPAAPAACQPRRGMRKSKRRDDASVLDDALNESKKARSSMADALVEFTCAICMEVMVGVTVLNCTHSFCKCCITQHLVKSQTCPICRASATSGISVRSMDSAIDVLVGVHFTKEQLEEREVLKQDRLVDQRITAVVSVSVYRDTACRACCDPIAEYCMRMTINGATWPRHWHIACFYKTHEKEVIKVEGLEQLHPNARRIANGFIL
jgi:hypothetical protein